MKTFKDILSERKEKKDLEKRIVRLEETVSKIQITIDVALDARVSYLEKNVLELKDIKPDIEKMTNAITVMKTEVAAKKRKPDLKDGMEIA